MSPSRYGNYSRQKNIADSSPVISLITDFGLKDNFVGVMKAVICRINPYARTIDICHEVKPQDILEAAFLLKSSYRYFPKGSVHLAVVDPGVGSKREKIIVRTRDYFFVAPDNGILAPTLKELSPVEIIEITNEKFFLKPVSDTFHGRDIFAPIAAYLSKGEPAKNFGKQIRSFEELGLPKVKVDSETLSGEVIHIDRFGNLVSNIDKDMLYKFIKDKKFEISIKNKTINRISNSYSESRGLRLVALIDSFDFLEIALNRASAKDYLGMDKGDKITVKKKG